MRLEHDEYVTALSGVHYQHRITSLTFHTNKRKHGPFCKKFEHLKDCKREIDVGVRDRSEFGGLFGSFAEKKYGYILDQSACMSLTIEAALTQSLEPGLELPMITSSFLWNHWIIQPRDFITKPRRLSTVFLSSLAEVVSPNSKTVHSPRLIKLFSSLLTFD